MMAKPVPRNTVDKTRPVMDMMRKVGSLQLLSLPESEEKTPKDPKSNTQLKNATIIANVGRSTLMALQ